MFFCATYVFEVIPKRTSTLRRWSDTPCFRLLSVRVQGIPGLGGPPTQSNVANQQTDLAADRLADYLPTCIYLSTYLLLSAGLGTAITCRRFYPGRVCPRSIFTPTPL